MNTFFTLLFNFQHNIKRAFRGWLFWKRLVRRKKLTKKTLVLLLPKSKDLYTYHFIAHIAEYVSRHDYKNVLVLTDNETVYKLFSYLNYSFSEIFLLSKKKLSNLLLYTSISKLSLSNYALIIGDLAFPDDRKSCLNFLKNRNLSIEELICYGVYGLFPFEPQKIDVDKKAINNADILDFVSLQK